MSILLYTDLRTDDNGNQQYNTIPNEQKKIINNMVYLMNYQKHSQEL
jgi:hypothetical protein